MHRGKLNTEFRIVVTDGESGIEMKSVWSVQEVSTLCNIDSFLKNLKQVW